MTKGVKKILAAAVCCTVLVSGLAFTGAAMSGADDAVEDSADFASTSMAEHALQQEDTAEEILEDEALEDVSEKAEQAPVQYETNGLDDTVEAVGQNIPQPSDFANDEISTYGLDIYSSYAVSSSGGGWVKVYDSEKNLWAELLPDEDTQKEGVTTAPLPMTKDRDVFYLELIPEEGMSVSETPIDYDPEGNYLALDSEKTENDDGTVWYKLTYRQDLDGTGNAVHIPVGFWVDVSYTLNLAERYTYMVNDKSTHLEVDLATPSTQLININHQWYSSTNGSTQNGKAIAGANGTTYAPPTNVSGTFYYYVKTTAAHKNYPVVTTTIVSNVTRVDILEPVYLNLSTAASPQNAGTVEVKGNIDNLTAGDSIQLVAKAAKGYTFESWGHNSDGKFSSTTNSETTFTFGEKDANITAVFSADDAEEPEFAKNLASSITLRQRGAGTTLAVEVKEPSDEGTLSYAWYKSSTPDGGGAQVGTSPSLEIDTGEPGTAYYYVNVTNSLDNGKTATAKSTVTKVEVLPTYQLYVLTGNSAMGTVGYNAANAILQNGDVYLAAGDEVEIWAEANPGFVFVGWAVNTEIDLQGNQNEARFQFTMQEGDLIVSATFATMQDAVAPKIAEIDLKDFHLAVQGDKILLEISLQNESELADVTYSWYRKNPDSASGRSLVANTTVGRLEIDTQAAGTYSYYVEVTNEDTGATGNQRTTATSPTITVVLEEKLAVQGIPESIRVEDTFTLSANVEGATGVGENGWIFDSERFSATFNSPATFTALQAGEATITFRTAAGQVWSAVVQIDTRAPATESTAASSSSSRSNAIVQTGDDAVPHLYLALMLGALAMLGAGLLVYKKSRSNPS